MYPEKPRDLNVTDNYIDNLIEFDDDQKQKLDDLVLQTEDDEEHWKELRVGVIDRFTYAFF